MMSALKHRYATWLGTEAGSNSNEALLISACTCEASRSPMRSHALIGNEGPLALATVCRSLLVETTSSHARTRVYVCAYAYMRTLILSYLLLNLVGCLYV